MKVNSNYLDKFNIYYSILNNKYKELNILQSDIEIYKEKLKDIAEDILSYNKIFIQNLNSLEEFLKVFNIPNFIYDKEIYNNLSTTLLNNIRYRCYVFMINKYYYQLMIPYGVKEITENNYQNFNKIILCLKENNIFTHLYKTETVKDMKKFIGGIVDGDISPREL